MYAIWLCYMYISSFTTHERDYSVLTTACFGLGFQGPDCSAQPEMTMTHGIHSVTAEEVDAVVAEWTASNTRPCTS